MVDPKVSLKVWICVDTSKQVGDRDHLVVFANVEAAEQWFRDNGYPDLSASEYEIMDSEQNEPNIVGGKNLWIYVDTRKRLGRRDHLKVFASENAAEKWLTENDLEGAAFGYEVLGSLPSIAEKRLGEPTDRAIVAAGEPRLEHTIAISSSSSRLKSRRG
jgi:hypothetical protein